MADSADQLLKGLDTEVVARPAASVALSDAAENDLKRLSRPTRALLLRTMRDQLLEPSRWHDVKPLTAGSNNDGWFELPIGNFRILFKPVRSELGQSGFEDRLVGRVVHAEDVERAQDTLDPELSHTPTS